MTNEIPPPPPGPADLMCPAPSEPPDVRRVRGFVAVFTPLIAFGIELAWMALVSYFFWHGKVSMEVWLGAGAAPVLGPMVAKMRGKPAVATSLLIIGALGKGGAAMAAGEVAKRTLLSVAQPDGVL